MLNVNLINFNLPNNYLACNRLVGGHINSTFKVTYPKPNGSYIVQTINSNVFASVPDLMDNISIVCDHLKSKNIPTLEYLPTNDGSYYYYTPTGEYIRVCKFVENSITLQTCSSLEQIYYAGKAFGEYVYHLRDVDTNQIHETIKDFHNTKAYLDRLFNVKLTSIDDLAYRLLDSVYQLREYANVTQALTKRLTHNDVKLANVLFDRSDTSKTCVIDLDTTMLGYVSYDFADGVRSMCRNADNTLNLQKFKAYSRGFLTYPLPTEEKSTLLDSVVAICLELSSRYLYEYLTNGDYFHLSTREEYLIKAQGYITLANDIINKSLN